MLPLDPLHLLSPPAARALLVKLLKEAKAGTAERSPHAKAEYSVDEFDDLSQRCAAPEVR